MSNTTCAKCGAKNFTDAKLCQHCGTALVNQNSLPINFAVEAVQQKQRINNSQRTLVGLIAALVLGSILYRLLVYGHLEQTSALFVGLPAVLAIALTLTPRARSATGMVMKGITICLLMSGILLGEGFICIVMASPLFFVAGLIIGVCVDYSRSKKQEQSSLRTYCLLLVLFLPLSVEGVNEKLSFARDEVVVAESTVAGRAVDVEQTLSSEPRFDKTLPLYLRMGFPRPAETSGRGLQVGDIRVIRFAGGEGQPGDLVLQVVESGPGMVRFQMLSDTSHISHWLDWKEAEVNWRETESGRTQVSWTLRYTRRLDPAWYFGPWERYAVRCAARYLIDTLATPGVRRDA